MKEKIEINTISLDKLTLVHRLCDKDFIPRLSSKVDIDDYCQKLYQKADTLSLLHNNQVVGLVSLYTNNLEARIAYVSSVCLLKEFRGKGYARLLLSKALEYAKAKGMLSIQLEVGQDNIAAIGLYHSFGFKFIENRAATKILELHLELEA